jgi:hypothetical protein
LAWGGDLVVAVLGRSFRRSAMRSRWLSDGTRSCVARHAFGGLADAQR